MTADRPPMVAVFGLGEAGSRFAADLASGGANVAGYDPASVETPDGVKRFESPLEAVKGADLVMAITAASDAQAAIAQAWNQIGRGTIYADLSTAPPNFKEDLNDTAALRGMRFADVALMAPVPGRGIATPSYASGPGAPDYALAVNDLGGNVEVVGEEAGQAAARKLLRSIVTKGLTAVVIEAMEGAAKLELDDWLWDHVVEFVETADRETIERLVEGTRTHVERRIVEMDSAALLLESLDVEPLTARATEALLKQVREASRRE